MTVWTREIVGYEGDRYLAGVSATLDAAVAAEKERFGPPYEVRWEEPVEVPDDRPAACLLVGHFDEVPGYSTRHDSETILTPWEVS